MIYIVDIDGTIANSPSSDYTESRPILERIDMINALYDDGHTIHYWTGRGGRTGIDWTALTTSQLKDWGCKYNQLTIGKPDYDHWIDDKAFNAEAFFNSRN
jgi:hypothetical protein